LKHNKTAETSRDHYRDDQIDIPETSVRSVDLQKVIMLPRLPGVKSAIFTKRIIAFHETFAAVGTKAGKQKKPKQNNISVIWHEAVAGRKAEEIASAFIKALQHERDTPHIVYWLDNCAAQNKNWCLLTTLVYYINNAELSSISDVTLKYFEKGHTFMSADSVHHGVEKAMCHANVYDFPDFVSVVSKSNASCMDVIQMTCEDFRNWKDGHSIAKMKKHKYA
jgi:hypothetical protein